MPLATVHYIECSDCGAYEYQLREPVKNQRAPAFVVPPGWTEDGDKHYCPIHTAARESAGSQ